VAPRGRLRLAAALVALAAPLAAAQAPIPQGGELVLSSQTTRLDGTPAVALDASGAFIVAWGAQGVPSGTGSWILGRRFDAQGIPAGPEFAVNSTFTANVSLPSLAAGAGGQFVVVWQESSPYGASSTVKGRRLGSDGTPLGSEFPLSSAPGNAGAPSAAGRPGGDYLVVWQAADGALSGVIGRRFDSAGTALGPEFVVNTTTAGNQGSPAVAADGTGFVVAWSASAGQSGVFGRRFDTAGSPQGPEQPLAAAGTAPASARDGRGRFAAAWLAGAVVARRFEADATPAGPEVALSAPGTALLGWPRLAGETSGQFLAAWDETTAVGPLPEEQVAAVLGRSFDGSGLLGPPFAVSTYTAGLARQPAVAVAAGGRALVVWSDLRGSLSGLSARRYLLDLVFRSGFQ
jgi:hypothetical protein